MITTSYVVASEVLSTLGDVAYTLHPYHDFDEFTRNSSVWNILYYEVENYHNIFMGFHRRYDRTTVP